MTILFCTMEILILLLAMRTIPLFSLFAGAFLQGGDIVDQVRVDLLFFPWFSLAWLLILPYWGYLLTHIRSRMDNPRDLERSLAVSHKQMIRPVFGTVLGIYVLLGAFLFAAAYSSVPLFAACNFFFFLALLFLFLPSESLPRGEQRLFWKLAVGAAVLLSARLCDQALAQESWWGKGSRLPFAVWLLFLLLFLTALGFASFSCMVRNRTARKPLPPRALTLLLSLVFLLFHLLRSDWLLPYSNIPFGVEVALFSLLGGIRGLAPGSHSNKTNA